MGTGSPPGLEVQLAAAAEQAASQVLVQAAGSQAAAVMAARLKARREYSGPSDRFGEHFEQRQRRRTSEPQPAGRAKSGVNLEKLLNPLSRSIEKN